MKTSASDTQQIDLYLLKQLAPGDKLVMDASFVLNPELNETLKWQQQVHTLVQMRGRKQLQNQIKAVEEKLFTAPEYLSFRERVWQLFR